MATELYRFIREQLSNLPADDPDRLFLEDQRREVIKYLKLKGRKILDANSFPDYLLSLKQGPFLTVGDLARVDTDLFLPTAAKRYIPEEVKRLREGIETYGDEALSHLCLPVEIDNALLRKGINTISELRSTLTFGVATGYPRGIGPKSADFLKQRLNLFDQKLQKSRQKPQ